MKKLEKKRIRKLESAEPNLYLAGILRSSGPKAYLQQEIMTTVAFANKIFSTIACHVFFIPANEKLV